MEFEGHQVEEGTGLRVVDTHAHLEEVVDLDLEIQKAKKAGVVAMIAVGTNTKANKIALDVSEKFRDYVFPAVGIHPWDTSNCSEEDVKFIRDNAGRCVAIGEVGLDFWIKQDQKAQATVFEKMLTLAKTERKPALVHSRGAWKDCFEAVSRLEVEKAVFHWYSGPLDVLEKILESGYYVSSSPAVEYSKHHREAIEKVPIERLLLETDSPVSYKGVKSTPSDVMKTLKYVSKLKGMDEPEVAEVTTRNAAKLFGLKLP